MYSGPRRTDAPSTDNYGPPQKGSVRAARERLRGVQGIPESPQIGRPPQRPKQPVSPYPPADGWSSNSNLAPISSDTRSRSPISPIPPAQPTPTQWPLGPAPVENNTPRYNTLPSNPRPSARGPPPQRPPRPRDVPSLLEPNDYSSPSQPQLTVVNRTPSRSPNPEYRETPAWIEDEYNDYSLRPPTISTNRTSTDSSLGSIPDFPVPISQPNPLPRRPPTLGPPPSARRGPSSYYSQISYVSPIQEESESQRGSRKSFASSNVIPSGGPSTYYYAEGETPSSDEEGEGEDGRTSRESNDEPTIIRSASVGKRQKPSMTTIRSNSDSDKTPPSTRKVTPASAVGVAVTLNATRPASVKTADYSSGTGLYDSASENSTPTSEKDYEKDLDRQLSSEQTPKSQTALVPVDPRVDEILKGLQRSGSIEKSTAERMKQNLATRVASRPETGRTQDSRSSMTSLPDLIRRATRLAANLDRGRTASRFGEDWMKDRRSRRLETPQENRERKSDTSLSDILGQFPPPGWATPTSERGQSSYGRSGRSQRPSRLNLADSAFTESEQQRSSRPKGRRVCGLPLWLFILLIILLTLLVAAAVVVPVVLILLPKLKQQRLDNAAAAALANCQKTTPCLNGGSSTVNSNGSCGCLCANAFTGPTCATPNLEGCTTLSTTGTSSATIGNSIPRLLDSATKNFSIPLDASVLLSLFSAADLSCSSENALVTFNGAASKRSAPAEAEAAINPRTPEPDTQNANVLSASATVPALTTITPTATDNWMTVTSNGIIFATLASPTTTRASLTVASSQAAVSSLVPAATATPAATMVEFARVAVLFVFQVSGSFDKAAGAQSTLQGLLGKGGNFVQRNVTVAQGFTVDLVGGRIGVGNGTRYGAS